MDERNLADVISQIVLQHSSGMKFTELISILASTLEEKRSEYCNPELVERAIRDDPRLGLFEYSHGPGGVKRWRGFVFIQEV